MPKSLVIVESPAKATTLKKYLGKDFQVVASVGHIKNLPKSKLGVDTENGFKPEFVNIKGKDKVIKSIRDAAKKADVIYLAPDPDREGEAIASHIAMEIGEGKELFRVQFNEITKKAVLKAMEDRGQIDQDRVNAQMARRILDRLMGYNLSPLLWDKVRKGLSAGRVQSVALRLVVEREKEILAFVPEEYWTVTAALEGKSPPTFEAKAFHHQGNKFKIGSGEEANKVEAAIKAAGLVIRKVEKKERKRNPIAPFITSSLQQEASRKLRFYARKTMSVAQKLYEGMDVGEDMPAGLITYMRTDSTRVSGEAVEEARGYIKTNFGEGYLPDKPNEYKTKKSAQDAHEAIRPTSVERTPDKVKDKLSKEEFALYELIWKRFLSSQMTPAVMDTTTVDVEAGEYTLRATGSIMKFDGFLKLYEESVDTPSPNGEKDDKDKLLPADLAVGDALKLDGVEKKQSFTQPPARYTEAMLIRDMEEKGIGRPSTYAGIMETIQEREYCKTEERRLAPTEMGVLVSDLLVENFPDIVNVEFTAKMEEELDRVEEGSKVWTTALEDFYTPFKADLEKAKKEMRNVKAEAEKTDMTCEKCGKPMVIKFGRFGKFVACTGYPECKNTMKLDKDGVPEEKPEAPPDEPTDFKCDKCGKPMVIKTGRFGRYIACVDYPECKTTRQIPLGVKCPKPDCGGDMVRKRSRAGRFFFGCDKYPDCDYTVWAEPVAEPCPECGHPILVKKALKAGNFLACPLKECGFKKQVVDEEIPA
ncbi:MAG: type I DNA topoisomerase [Nitrospinota bacterium]|nr:type I DNA topoisomerase [Nitrospinota bacterium]